MANSFSVNMYLFGNCLTIPNIFAKQYDPLGVHWSFTPCGGVRCVQVDLNLNSPLDLNKNFGFKSNFESLQSGIKQVPLSLEIRCFFYEGWFRF